MTNYFDEIGLPDARGQDPELSVSEFVAVLNQTLAYSYPSVTITGELANLRISRNQWVYFDLKDEQASVKFFGTVRQLPGPLENGMMLRVRGQPRLHALYGFSVTVQYLQAVGEGSINRAAQLLQARLQAEGLFDEARKRPLPYPPQRIALITSRQSAAYADFVKVLGARWSGISIELCDVQVQGEVAPQQIVAALAQCNALAEPPEVIVVIRGGGSAEDLAAFSTEQVTRAVAASRVPTLVAIGHEIDSSLAELAADKRASTPSNAAELLVPDAHGVANNLATLRRQLQQLGAQRLSEARDSLRFQREDMEVALAELLRDTRERLVTQRTLLKALSPQVIMARGYAVVRTGDQTVRSRRVLQPGAIVDITFADGSVTATVVGESERRGIS